MGIYNELEDIKADPFLAIKPEEYENHDEIQTIKKKKLQNSEWLKKQ